MSHFVVLVTKTDEDSVESQLEPFFEQGDEDDYFMEKDYWLTNDKAEIDKWLDNEIKSFEELLKKPDTTADGKKWWEKGIKELNEIKKIDTVKGQLEAIKEHEGCGLDEKGLYWINNPNAKWDWWTVGGRWDGWLIDKNGIKCNVCKAGELDLGKMRETEVEYARQSWNAEMDRAREHGYAPSMFGWEKFPSREEYAKSFDKPVAPYAFLHDGEWVERGEMGWWGISDDKFSAEEWDNKFGEFIQSLDPETEITIVDCHI